MPVCSELGKRGLNCGFGISDDFALGDAVLAEVKRLLLHHVVLADVSVLSRPQEGLDALRVVAQSEKVAVLCRCCILCHLSD